MLIPAFTIEIGHPILRGLTCIGKFDGKNPALTCATSAGKIFFHSPHEKDQKNQVRFLNINRKISALGAGRLNPKLGKDLLLVGAQTTLLCYDVLENKDLFFKDAPDGVNTLVVGKLSGLESEPLVFVGGNCSIQGFDAKGDEAFWTVTGDNVSTMCFCDVDEDGDLELLVGSDDYEIRVFRNEEVVSETTETDRIVALCNIRKTTFGYALANGTVGVYSGPGQRRWRVKAKQQVTCISGFDLDGDGQPELLSGWSNGKFEVRSDTSGEVIFKDTLRDGAAISGILQADYRGDGRVEVIACSAEGEVRGYLPSRSMGDSVVKEIEASAPGRRVEASGLKASPHLLAAPFIRGEGLVTFLRSFFATPAPGTFSIDARNGARLKAHATVGMESEWLRLLRPLVEASRVDMQITRVPSRYHLLGYQPVTPLNPAWLAVIRSQRIFFEAGGLALAEEEEAKLEPLAYLLMEAGPAMRVVVAGYSDPLGEPGGESLRLRRAGLIRDRLLDYGVAPEVVQAEGFEVVRAPGVLTEDQRRFGRSVEFLVP
jgi:outer membrane protein OmpA-like peptidoglycan-associated protein